MSGASKLSAPTLPVYLKATGAVTAIGLTSEHIAAAVRAGISAYQESAMSNKRSDSMITALLPEDVLPLLKKASAGGASVLTARQQRLIQLAQLALNDLQGKCVKLDDLPLFLAGPETLPAQTAACHPQLIHHISTQSEIRFHDKHSVLMPTGRAGGAWALQCAMAYVQAGYSQYAIVGGVDSYLDHYLLATLDSDDRILAQDVMNGFAPGEGAGFFLISGEPESFEKTDQIIKIYPPGLAREPGHRYSEAPYKGDGLADAFTLALDAADLPSIKTIMASLNGENFGSKELGVAVTRNSDRFDPNYAITHPADCFGDIGAAFFPISVALTAAGMLKNYLPEPVLNYASSENEHRAAVCLSKV